MDYRMGLETPISREIKRGNTSLYVELNRDFGT